MPPMVVIKMSIKNPILGQRECICHLDPLFRTSHKAGPNSPQSPIAVIGAIGHLGSFLYLSNVTNWVLFRDHVDPHIP